MKEETISGIIIGEEKDQDLLNEYMLSTVSAIKEELLMKYQNSFRQHLKNLYMSELRSH